ncbi:Actin-like ATPase domain-containing protein [Fusarium falciforme]|uniref:Actin-like ATPase domain-containing protein n=1 Tax=Fusarium falciforme TaxID=195108 RepID=UPI0023018464|nr:Actin-like ATPase domain-containing protein [Fusarium falciforme]WAO91176.1 Actin-like ATPase domain-containing protein [Fusarium falciforme]
MSRLDDALRSMGGLNLNQGDGLRLIVGFDFGTTYSGIAWVLSNRTKADQIEVINIWPDGPFQVPKAPSVIAYASENKDRRVKEDRWGYSVVPGMSSYLWTKLLLGGNVAPGEYDDPALKEYFGPGLLSLPPGKTAQDICSDYMACLYKYFVGRFQGGTRVNLKITPMEVWITVPAIWTDAAKRRTMEAAKAAGFGSRIFLGDTISVITEPEAAALTILKPRLDSHVLPTASSKNVLVCDCGGGTVDIICYKIKSDKARASFKELCRGTGAKCGSTAIDRAFDTWMKRRFGDAYKSVPLGQKGPGSKFMTAFESAKRRFSGSEDIFEIYPINLAVAQSELYDKSNMTILLPSADMQSLFDPVIDSIIRLVNNQIGGALRDHGERIEEVFLVGGFGDSLYLNQRMTESCKSAGITVACPPQCQAAIATGAALRGLFGLKPDSRICRRHYGYSIRMPFRERVDHEDDASYSSWDNTKMCDGRIQWVAKLNEHVDDDTTAGFGVSWDLENHTGGAHHNKIEIFYSEWEQAPEYTKHWSVKKLGLIKITFTSDEISTCERTWNSKLGKKIIKLRCTVKVDLNADTGLIEYRTMIGDREAGYASFEFDKEEAT